MQNRLYDRLSLDNANNVERVPLPSRSKLPLVLTSACVSLALVLTTMMLVDSNGISLTGDIKVGSLIGQSHDAAQASLSDRADVSGTGRVDDTVGVDVKDPAGKAESARLINLTPVLPEDEREALLGDFASPERGAIQLHNEFVQQLVRKATVADARLDALDRSFDTMDQKLSQLETLIDETKTYAKSNHAHMLDEVKTLSASLTTIEQRFDTLADKTEQDQGADIGGSVTKPDISNLLRHPVKKIIDVANVNADSYRFFPERRTAILSEPSIPRRNPGMLNVFQARVSDPKNRPVGEIITGSIGGSMAGPVLDIERALSQQSPTDKAKAASQKAIQAKLARKLRQNLGTRSARVPLSPLSESILGLDLGEVDNLDQVRRVWQQLLKTDGKLIAGMVPAVTVTELNKSSPKLRLLVGPVNDADEIARVCAALVLKRPCRPALFEGTRVSLR